MKTNFLPINDSMIFMSVNKSKGKIKTVSYYKRAWLSTESTLERGVE